MPLQAKQATQQRLMLAPNVTLALEVLRMPTLELKALLEHQLEENPLLELNEVSEEEGLDASSTEESNGKEEPQQPGLDEEWLSHWRTAAEREDPGDDSRADEWVVDQRFVVAQSLHDSLRLQLGCQQLSSKERQLGELIIDHLDEYGYLEGTLEELAAETGASLEELEAALKLIQRFDPPGVGARDLRECLMIQLEHKDACGSLPAPAASQSEAAGAQAGLSYRILQDHFQLFAQRRLDAIAKATGAALEEVAKAFECLTQLNPKPGRVFAGVLPPSIVPDLVIQKRDQHYDVELNDQEVPHVAVSRVYYRMLKDPRTPSDAKEFLLGKFRQASWLIKAIDERNTTLLSIARCLISLQRDFIEQGTRALKPLTQAQVASLIGRHASTVSRAITGKTIDTPYGILPLDRLFASGVPQTHSRLESDSISDQTIKAELQRLIAEEDPHHPLSDAALAKRLAERNISVARRTIAKYRTSLKTLPAHLRKRRL